jgi:2-polyprenyl-3-methyl-5-hydroxy-6-metoxy-1,4-benzoquinol methylase
MKASEADRAIPDLGPESYARWRGSDIGDLTERIERRLILGLAGDVSGLRVLDVGCGDGTLALELWKRGASVTAIDSSVAMIDEARKRAEAQKAIIDFKVAVAEELPFPAQQFDVVTAVTILCFIGDAAPAFQEIARVLRPGGRLVIGELGKWSLWAAGRRLRAWFGSGLWRRSRFRTAAELRRLASQAGLVVRQTRGAIYYPRWSFAAQLLAPWDAALGNLTTFGAAFVAILAEKPQPRDGASS